MNSFVLRLRYFTFPACFPFSFCAGLSPVSESEQMRLPKRIWSDSSPFCCTFCLRPSIGACFRFVCFYDKFFTVHFSYMVLGCVKMLAALPRYFHIQKAIECIKLSDCYEIESAVIVSPRMILCCIRIAGVRSSVSLCRWML